MHGKIIDLATYLLNIVRIVSKNKAVGILILCFYSHSISGPLFSSYILWFMIDHKPHKSGKLGSQKPSITLAFAIM